MEHRSGTLNPLGGPADPKVSGAGGLVRTISRWQCFPSTRASGRVVVKAGETHAHPADTSSVSPARVQCALHTFTDSVK